MKKKSMKLKERLAEPEITIMPGVHDGYSARIVELSGFDVAWISGAGISESHLGWADRGAMGLQETVTACRDIVNCTDLILLGDADTGYGNAMNVYFSVRAFEQVGLAGVMLEDQTGPKRCGHMAGKDVISREEARDKIAAAADARRDEEFVIKARTDAAGVLGVDEAIERLNLYADAGADLLFADALLSPEDIEKVASNVSTPLSVNMGFGIRARGTTPLIGPKDLESMGVAAVIYPRLLTSAALRGMMNAMDVFKGEVIGNNGTPDRTDLMISFEELNEITGMAQLDDLEARFTGVK